MAVLGKGWAAAKPTTGSSYVALGLNARKKPLLAVTLQLDDIIVGANHTGISLAPMFRLSGVMSQYFTAKILYSFLFSPLALY
jgi:hypothetical protein